MVAYIVVMLGVIREWVALTVIYLDIVLYSVGGVGRSRRPTEGLPARSRSRATTTSVRWEQQTVVRSGDAGRTAQPTPGDR
jgi:hypothetical protein